MLIRVRYCHKWNGSLKTVTVKVDYTSEKRILTLTAEALNKSPQDLVIKGWEAA